MADLRWLGVGWDEGPVRQSERQERYRKAAAALGGDRFGRITLLRPDGTATYHLASVVDDLDFGITHVVRGHDHAANTRVHADLFRALGAEPPEFVLHGLILGPDGKKLSKRAEGATVASLREAGIPAEALRAYLEELGLPRHDVRLDLGRIRRLAVETLAALGDEELAARVGVPVSVAPVLRGARDLAEARAYAELVLSPPAPRRLPAAAETFERFRALAELEPDELVRELRASHADLKSLRLALTGRDSGPELRAILAALPREEAIRRVDQALQHAHA